MSHRPAVARSRIICALALALTVLRCSHDFSFVYESRPRNQPDASAGGSSGGARTEANGGAFDGSATRSGGASGSTSEVGRGGASGASTLDSGEAGDAGAESTGAGACPIDVCPPSATCESGKCVLECLGGCSETFRVNGSASREADDAFTLTNGASQAGSFFAVTPIDVAAFHVTFRFSASSGAGGVCADGFAFVLAASGPDALGRNGLDLGYGGIARSFAVKFDLFQNPGDPDAHSTGYFVNGAPPVGGRSLDYVALCDRDTSVTLDYEGTNLHIVLRDETTNAQFDWLWSNVDIAGTLGTRAAYLGFTGGTGDSFATQTISNLSLNASPALGAKLPMGSTDAGSSCALDAMTCPAGTHCNDEGRCELGCSPDCASLLALNGSAQPSPTGGVLLTDASSPDEIGSAFFPVPIDASRFSVDFEFLGTPAADDGCCGEGITFTIVADTPHALGLGGSGLGYQGIAHSFALKLDTSKSPGDLWPHSVYYALDGAAPLNGPPLPNVIGVQDQLAVEIGYDGSKLSVDITDLDLQQGAHFEWTVDIAAALGSRRGYFGFTGSTSALKSAQQIQKYRIQFDPG